MKFDVRIAFAAIALALGACQGGGLDSGGMGGMMGPPVQQPGPMGSGGELEGPTIGANGQAELTQPGATLAPNQSQFAIADAPNGVKCPLLKGQMQQYGCTLSFNIPTPAPAGSGGATPSPKPTPSPTPTASASASDEGDDSDSGDGSSPPPMGTITLQYEPLPTDVPAMTNPDPRALRITPVAAIRLQSDTDFALSGGALVTFSMPRQQVFGRSFAIQLYDEAALRGKRTDQFIATYTKGTIGDTTVQFAFPTPKVTVKRGQIWLLALYGMQFPPGSTPTPSPSPAASGSASPAASPSPSPTSS